MWLWQHVSSWWGKEGGFPCTVARQLGVVLIPLPFLPSLFSTVVLTRVPAHGQVCQGQVSANCIHATASFPHGHSWKLPGPSTALHQLGGEKRQQCRHVLQILSPSEALHRLEPVPTLQSRGLGEAVVACLQPQAAWFLHGCRQNSTPLMHHQSHLSRIGAGGVGRSVCSVDVAGSTSMGTSKAFQPYATNPWFIGSLSVAQCYILRVSTSRAPNSGAGKHAPNCWPWLCSEKKQVGEACFLAVGQYNHDLTVLLACTNRCSVVSENVLHPLQDSSLFLLPGPPVPEKKLNSAVNTSPFRMHC